MGHGGYNLRRKATYMVMHLTARDGGGYGA